MYPCPCLLLPILTKVVFKLGRLNVPCIVFLINLWCYDLVISWELGSLNWCQQFSSFYCFFSLSVQMCKWMWCKCKKSDWTETFLLCSIFANMTLGVFLQQFFFSLLTVDKQTYARCSKLTTWANCVCTYSTDKTSFFLLFVGKVGSFSLGCKVISQDETFQLAWPEFILLTANLYPFSFFSLTFWSLQHCRTHLLQSKYKCNVSFVKKVKSTV